MTHWNHATTTIELPPSSVELEMEAADQDERVAILFAAHCWTHSNLDRRRIDEDTCDRINDSIHLVGRGAGGAWHVAFTDALGTTWCFQSSAV